MATKSKKLFKDVPMSPSVFKALDGGFYIHNTRNFRSRMMLEANLQRLCDEIEMHPISKVTDADDCDPTCECC